MSCGREIQAADQCWWNEKWRNVEGEVVERRLPCIIKQDVCFVPSCGNGFPLADNKVHTHSVYPQ